MSVEPRRVIPAFACHIIEFDDPAHEQHASMIVDECVALRGQGQGIRRSNHAGSWHSNDDLFKQKTPGLVHVQEFIKACLRSALSSMRADEAVSLNLSMLGWININDQHAMNAPHNHPSSLLSGCYYVKVPPGDERSGLIEFLDPRAGANMIRSPYKDFQPTIRVHPRAGSLILFPSFLYHWVYPNLEPETRISIAFNVHPDMMRPA
jgi:uncharacterized protein (TIGR02466 family)